MADGGTAYDERLTLAQTELDRLVRRLRSLSMPAWRSRRKPVEICLDRLVNVAARIEKRKACVLPTIVDHALADAVAVVGGDAISAFVTVHDADGLGSVIDDLRAALAATS